ncbi:Bug family tripartite tricarboxylate transporter substrate binding protein [Ramlibacter sp.]|uniref:Bug family tripartite tricarboxylate transporter substrate binding protein n=1 Tax=Ramlibacter sp. TaxID=1917967 RepID=UPI003D127AF9
MNRRECIAAVVGMATAAAWAQEFPARELRIVVPLAPGGGTDTITRQITEKLARQLGKPVIVENKGGAGTTIGMAAAAAAAPDGHTVVVNGDTVAIFEQIFANLKFDVFKDFAPVAYFASAPIVLAAHPGFAPKNVAELVALAKKEPGKVPYATPGVGTPHDLAGLLMMQKGGIRLNEIQYKGNGPALADLLAGHVSIGMFTISSVLPHIRSGKLKALAVVGDKRTPVAPEFPSMGESGLAGVDVSSRYVILAPAATPKPVLARWNSAIREITKQPDTAESFLKLGYETMVCTLEESAALLRAERDRWKPVLLAANVKPQ